MRRITTPEELSKEYSRIPEEWIQFLTENCSNPKVWILADETTFIVLLNCDSSPISNYFAIILKSGDYLEKLSRIRDRVNNPIVMTIGNSESTPDGFEVVSKTVKLL